MGYSRPVASTIPAVLDALIAMAAAALPDVQVTDGPPVGDIADDIVAIGTTGREGEVAVQEARTAARLSTAPDGESYGISCVASSWRGATADMKPVRDQVFAMYDALAEQLALDPMLAGTVMRARMSVSSYFQDQTTADEDTGSGAGAVATLSFTVDVDAFTGRS